MQATPATPLSSNVHDLESWNRSILCFDLDSIASASADDVIEQSLSALFDDDPSASPVKYENCDEFSCAGYWPVM